MRLLPSDLKTGPSVAPFRVADRFSRVVLADEDADEGDGVPWVRDH